MCLDRSLEKRHQTASSAQARNMRITANLPVCRYLFLRTTYSSESSPGSHPEWIIDPILAVQTPSLLKSRPACRSRNGHQGMATTVTPSVW